MKTDKNSQNQKPKEQPKQETPQPEKPKTEREKSYSPEDLNKLSQRRQQILKNEVVKYYSNGFIRKKLHNMVDKNHAKLVQLKKEEKKEEEIIIMIIVMK